MLNSCWTQNVGAYQWIFYIPNLLCLVVSAVKAKFHYTCPTGPARTRTDFFARPGPQTLVSDKVRGLCLVGSGRARVVEFSYYRCRRIPTVSAASK